LQKVLRLGHVRNSFDFCRDARLALFCRKRGGSVMSEILSISAATLAWLFFIKKRLRNAQSLFSQ